MDIIIICVVLSLIIWIFSLPFSKNRKTMAEDFIDALKGGIGIGIVYVVIVALFIVAVRLIIYLYVKMFFAD